MMTATGQSSRRFLIFKYSVYGLLALNILLYLTFGSLHEAIDSLGWVMLLGAFEYETTAMQQDYSSQHEKYLLWAVQAVGYGLAIYATWEYYHIHDWANFVNAVTWLAVCAAIFYDVHVPGTYGGLEWRLRNAFKAALYVVLVAVALWWTYKGLVLERDSHALLELYDAVLWIVCFAVIELNIFASETTPDPQTAA